jgi:hypothetical protein
MDFLMMAAGNAVTVFVILTAMYFAVRSMRS